MFLPRWFQWDRSLEHLRAFNFFFTSVICLASLFTTSRHVAVASSTQEFLGAIVLITDKALASEASEWRCFKQTRKWRKVWKQQHEKDERMTWIAFTAQSSANPQGSQPCFCNTTKNNSLMTIIEVLIWN